MQEPFDPASLPADMPCPFCNISAAYSPYSPTFPPPTDSPELDPDKVSPPSFIVLSTPLLIGFLDLLPLSRGHLLLCPRRHAEKLTDVTPTEAAELGRYLRILSKALTKATGILDWNVVQNNGAAAAQVVGHAHFHIIPRPEIRATGRLSESFTMFGRGLRQELDEEEAVALAERVRQCTRSVLEEEDSKGKL